MIENLISFTMEKFIIKNELYCEKYQFSKFQGFY